MEGSLASIFMEGSLPSLPISWATSGESIEELQQRLVCTSMELESAREAAKVQSKLNETKLWQLQGLLETTRKERDEARREYGKLQEFLLHLSNPSQATAAAAESPCSLLQSISSTSSSAQVNHHSPASPSVEVLGLEDLHQKAYADDHIPSFEHGVDHKPFSHQAQDMQAMFSLELNQDPSSTAIEDSQQQFSMDILNKDMGLNEEQSLDLIDLQVEQPVQSTWAANLSSNSSWEANLSSSSNSGRTLTCQSSCVSSAASQFQGAIETPRDPAIVSKQTLAIVSKQTLAMPSHQTLTMSSHHALAMPSHPTLAMATSEASALVNKASQPHPSPMQLKLTHVAELPASNLKDMLSSLPEKGKLLQAVMQAGPLLQTLLLAGPLPQWRHPPPQLSTMDIPKLPMYPNSMAHGYLSPSAATNNHAYVMQSSSLMSYNVSCGLANPANVANYRGGLGAPSVPSTVNMIDSAKNPCSRGRKLRKLSPIGVK